MSDMMTDTRGEDLYEYGDFPKIVVKEIHHHHYYPYPSPQPQIPRYPYMWHGILPPPAYTNWYYEPTYTTTTHTKGIERYDSI